MTNKGRGSKGPDPTEARARGFCPPLIGADRRQDSVDRGWGASEKIWRPCLVVLLCYRLVVTVLREYAVPKANIKCSLAQDYRMIPLLGNPAHSQNNTSTFILDDVDRKTTKVAGKNSLGETPV